MITGYTDRFSLRAGERLAVKVSSGFDADYRADLVRIVSADPNPEGPGMDIRPVAAAFEGSYPSVFKPSRPGSCAVIPLGTALPDAFDLSLTVQPRLISASEQVILSLCDGDALLTLSLTETGLRFGQEGHLPCALDCGQWYGLHLRVDAGAVALDLSTLDSRTIAQGRATAPVTQTGWDRLILAARPEGAHFTGFFNGRIEGPVVTSADGVVAAWDFGRGIPTAVIHDTGPHALHGRLVNLPARAMRGSRWSGAEMCWRHAPSDYAAIEFHEDDLYDCGWDTDFHFDVPCDLPSGVYGIRLRCAGAEAGAEDIIPVFVRPAAKAPRNRVAVLFSTLTYLAYSNYPRTNFGPEYRRRRADWSAYPHHPAEHPQFGRSMYDRHPDGGGVMFSSMHRPQLLMRPGQIAYLDAKGSGLRHFPADMHLIAWCAAKGIAVDVVTDHDLEEEGVTALQGYDLIMTVTHPEYHTSRTLDAIGAFIDTGGNLAYLGGNGFYWRVAVSPDWPGAIELRRGESGVRMWEVETGEAHHAFDGQYGGLWLKNDRPPQRLVGIGMSAQGPFDAGFYRRTAASRDPSLAWLFAGIEGEILGDFGLSGGGAAGFELDCTDTALGTDPAAVVIARSEGHGTDYNCVPEKVWDPDRHTRAWQKDQIVAEMCLTPKPGGNFAFATGSIMFCGSLPVNDFRNPISTLLENVVRRAVATGTTATEPRDLQETHP